MTEQQAQQIGIEAAREAYRQWDQWEYPYELVWRHCTRLHERMRAEGLTGDDAFVWGTAGLAFRDEAAHLFGVDYVVAGQ